MSNARALRQNINFINVSMPCSLGKSHTDLGTQINRGQKKPFEKVFLVKLYEMSQNNIIMRVLKTLADIFMMSALKL